MKNKKNANLIINVISSILGLFQSCIVILFPQGVTEYGYVALYLFRYVIFFMFYSMTYTIIRDLLVYSLNLKSSKNINFDSKSYILYCIASAIGTLGIILLRPIEIIGFGIVVINIIVNSIIMYRKKEYVNTYKFYEELAEENRTNKQIKDLKRKEIKWSISGIFLGILPSIPLLITYLIINSRGLYTNNNSFEVMTVASIAISILSLVIIPILVEQITGKIFTSHLNKKNFTEKYWLLENICLKSYFVFTLLSFFIVLTFVLKLDYIYAMGLSVIAYFISQKRLPLGHEPLPDWAYGSEKNSYTMKDNKVDYNSGLSVTYFKDAKGNYSGSARSYNLGGVEYTEFKDETGNTTATGTSVDIGGIKHTTYKKK